MIFKPILRRSHFISKRSGAGTRGLKSFFAESALRADPTFRIPQDPVCPNSGSHCLSQNSTLHGTVRSSHSNMKEAPMVAIRVSTSLTTT